MNSHDHGTATVEAFWRTKGAWLRSLLEEAARLGIRCTDCQTLYQERLASRG